jgi:predicted RecA/RadA family phage recombinase
MARLISGSGLHADYTPSGAVANGELVVQGSLVGMADNDIAATAKGALVISGVIIAVAKDTGSADTIAVGAQLYWDSGNEVATTTADSNKKLGTSVAAAVAAATEVYLALGQHVA